MSPSNLRLIVTKFKSMSIGDFISKASIRIYKIGHYKIRALLDRFRDTRSSVVVVGLRVVLDAKKVYVARYSSNSKRIVTDFYTSHNFDLLGSGWVHNCYSEISDALPNKRKLKIGASVRSEVGRQVQKLHPSQQKRSLGIYKLIRGPYTPIDWQLDMKSGHRWLVKDASVGIKYGTKEGIDIKVPIELGRLQHLTQMAMFAIAEPQLGSTCVREVRNQVLDFVALNPPRFGVNWIFSMDVGIRVANMLLAVDVCRQICPDEIDAEFISVFTSSVYDHGLHIVNNLEYSRELTSNHYLANIVGLLFVSVYLESTPEVDRWLAFSIQELISEFSRQFYEDGVNFEGSSSYHRLSTEMLIYARALIMGLPAEKVDSLRGYRPDGWKMTPQLKELKDQQFRISGGKVQLPNSIDEKLICAVQFSYDITKQNGSVWQFGDNDSGRFVKFLPPGVLLNNGEAWKGDCLDHRELFSAATGLFGDIGIPSEIPTVDSIIANLAGFHKVTRTESTVPQCSDLDCRKLFGPTGLTFCKRIIIRVADHGLNGKDSLITGLDCKFYPLGGILIYKTERMFLGLNCVPNGSNGNGGHNHNDQLSIELQVDGVDVSADPGAYLYTSNPNERNNFRSVNAHNTLRAGFEPNRFFGSGDALFAKENTSVARFVEIKDHSVTMQLQFRGVHQQRTVSIENDCICIRDLSNREFDNELNVFGRFSPAFGKILDGPNRFAHVTVEYHS